VATGRWYAKVFLSDPAQPDRGEVTHAETIRLSALKDHLDRRRMGGFDMPVKPVKAWVIDKTMHDAREAFGTFKITKVVVKELAKCRR